MGVNKKSDGRYIVGANVTTANEYKGSLGWRDIFIQLTADGATAESIEKLEFMRDYAIYHSGKGNPVMPPSVAVWISNNGTTTAVEADDISYTDGVYTICGIKWENNAWDFSNAGQGGGGGGGLPPVTSEDNGDVLGVVDGAWGKMAAPSGLPSYTSADKRKFLGIANADPVVTEITVVPEQSVSVTNQGRPETPQYIGTLENVDFSHLEDGDTVTTYVNGSTLTGTYREQYESISGGGCIIYKQSDEYLIELYEGNVGTYTISAVCEKSVVPSITTTIVPEQTVTMIDTPALVSGADATMFVEGESGTITCDGVDYSAICVVTGGNTIFADPDDVCPILFGLIDGNVACAVLSDPGTYTVSLTKSVPAVAPKWETVSGGAEKITLDPNTGSLDKTFSELKALMSNNLCFLPISDPNDQNFLQIYTFVQSATVKDLQTQEIEGFAVIAYENIGGNTVRFVTPTADPDTYPVLDNS